MANVEVLRTAIRAETEQTYQQIRMLIDAELDVLLKERSLWASLPERRYEAMIARYYAPRLARALRSAFTNIPQTIDKARSIYSTKVVKADDAAAEDDNAAYEEGLVAAAAAMAAELGLDSGEVEEILSYIYADAYISGVHAVISRGDVHLDAPEAVAAIIEGEDWRLWGPSESAAANLIREGGLADLLDAAGFGIKSLDASSVADGLIETALTKLGNAIAFGLDNGLPTDVVADNIDGLVTQNADMIAVTETARAQSAATVDTLMANGVQQYKWIAEDDACKRCLSFREEGPYDLPPDPGNEDPSHPSQPAHPWCRCSIAAVVEIPGEDDSDGG